MGDFDIGPDFVLHQLTIGIEVKNPVCQDVVVTIVVPLAGFGKLLFQGSLVFLDEHFDFLHRQHKQLSSSNSSTSLGVILASQSTSTSSS